MSIAYSQADPSGARYRLRLLPASPGPVKTSPAIVRARRIAAIAAIAGLAGTTAAADPIEADSRFACLGEPAAVQQLRDNLETALTYLKATKNNFGAGRQAAIDATASAISEFEHLQTGVWIEPTPGTKTARYVGEHGHPRMMLASRVLAESRKMLKSPRCAGATALEPLVRLVDKALARIDDAFIFNPPGSHH